jgi:trehalose 6-phosphate synthase/phosphatase
MLLGLLGCDIIAFHTYTYAINFLDCCFNILGTRIDKHELYIEYGNKTIQVKALPIGIHYNWFEEKAKSIPKQFSFVKEKVILSIDRLDYTKGIVHRVHGYERFLEKYPEYREKVVLIQIIVPSRSDLEEYKNLKDELEREVGRISGRFCTSDWMPIKYIYKSISQHELTGIYRDSAIALITPIRDGMNLAAKEYVACQVDDPGVLIISPFTGTGETMLEALSVNPLEKDMLADCIKKALSMCFHERNLRINALKTRERFFNIDAWIDSFFEACQSVGTSNVAFKALSIIDMESWLAPIITGYRLTFIFDYDGTLVPLTTHPDLAILSDAVKGYLEELSSFPEIDVCILSGRSLKNLKKMVQIKNINLAGSHAMELEIAHTNEVIENEQAIPFKSKIPELVQDLTDKVCKYGGWVETKVYHVAFHWRETDINFQQTMKLKAKVIIERRGFQYKEGHFVLEVTMC